MSDALKVAVRDTAFFVRNVPMRMPFRFGAVTLRAAAVLHVRMEVELASGQRAVGWAADMLAPKWFDKDPNKHYGENVGDLLEGARAAAVAYLQIGQRADSAFSIWQQGCQAGVDWGAQRGLNGLLAANGPSLQERALIDAIGAASGMSYHQLLVSGALGIELGAVHEELASMPVAHAVAAAPLEALSIRHTVGLIDPIRRGDIAPEHALEDGLPQSLEEYVEAQGVRYVKIKIGGDARADFERLASIAALLDGCCSAGYWATLDGNEQYGDMDALVGLLERVERELPGLYAALLYVEQPLDRAVALAPELAPLIEQVSARRPMLIDESDEDNDAFKRALELGYRGVSSKACKGMIKALANAALVRQRDDGSGRYFMSAEDLTNIPVVGLHQDLAHVAALGMGHVERNGHHYVRGLDHLSLLERAQCRSEHPTLYRDVGDVLTLAIDGGQIDISSLQRPGLGGGEAVDMEAMVPLESWQMGELVEGNT